MRANRESAKRIPGLISAGYERGRLAMPYPKKLFVVPEAVRTGTVNINCFTIER
jgi:hypothetical protein